MTGSRSLDAILIGFATLATLGCLGLFVFTEVLYERPLPQDKVEKSELIKSAEISTAPEVFALKKMIINLSSHSSRLRFLDLEVNLVPFKGNMIEQFEAQKPFIQDAIIDITSNMAPEELNTVAGKVLLEERIRHRLNDFYGKPLVKEVLFSRFVVQ